MQAYDRIKCTRRAGRATSQDYIRAIVRDFTELHGDRRFGDDPAKMKQAGVIYATEQIIDLISNGVTHIHVYSMNKPDIAAGIMQSRDAIWDHSFTQKNKF